MQFPGTLHLHAAVEHSALSRIVVPLTQDPSTSSQEDESSQAQQSACRKLTDLAAQNNIHCIVWASGITGGRRADALVLCLHKASVTKAFKSIYMEQARLGVKLSTDIKAAVTLKPMLDEELQMAQAIGVARILEGTGWHYLHMGLWLHPTVPFLSSTPGATRSAHCVQLSIQESKTATGVLLLVQRAGRCSFTPFSVACELGLQPSPTSAATELQLLQQHVFSSAQAARKASRKLYNTVATLLPTCRHVFIKGVKLLLHPQQQQDVLDKWSSAAPWLPLPADAKDNLSSLGLLVLEVSQDPDADTGDCTVWDVPAACCWTCAGLVHAPPSVNSQEEQTAAMQQVKQSLTSNAAGVTLLWGGKPLQLTTNPAQDNSSTTYFASAAGRIAAPGTASHCRSMMDDEVALSSQQLQPAGYPASQGAQQAAGLWATASQWRDAPTQNSTHKQDMHQGQQLGAGGQCDKILSAMPVHATACYHSCRPEAVGTYMRYQGGSCATDVAIADCRQAGSIEPHIAAIMAGRQSRLETEAALWNSLQPVLNKLQQEQEQAVKQEHRCSTAKPAAGIATKLGQQAGGAPRPVIIGSKQLSTSVGASRPAVISKAAQKPPKVANHPTIKTAAKTPAAAAAVPAVSTAKPVTATGDAAGVLAAVDTGKTLPVKKAQPAKRSKPTPAAATAAAAAAGAGAGSAQAAHVLEADTVHIPAAVPSAPQEAAPAVSSQATAASAAAAAAPARKRTKASDLDTAQVEAKVAAKAASGTLSGLSVPEMQAWLRARKMPVGGKKADLEARLAAALGLSVPGQA